MTAAEPVNGPPSGPSFGVEAPYNLLFVLSHLAQRHTESTTWLEQAFSGWADLLAEQAVRLVTETSDPLDPRDPVGRVVTAMFQARDPSPDLALKLYEAIPPQTVAWKELAVVVTSRLLRQEHAAPTPDLFRIGSLQNDLGNRLSALGRLAEAAAMAEDAVRSLRQLAQVHPEHRGRLAVVLANLATAREGVGNFAGAFADAEEAVAIARTGHAADPSSTRARADLAHCLTSQAGKLRIAAMPGRALAAARESVSLYRTLVAEDRGRYARRYVVAMEVLAVQYGELGQHEEQRAAAAEVVEDMREHSLAYPDVYQPSLAETLNILATSLRELRRFEPAIETHLEAIHILRKLARQRPDVYDELLAANLNNVADCYRLVDQQDEAIAAAREATDLFSTLARRNHEVFALSEARSANTLSAMYWNAKQFERAQEASGRAVAIYRDLVARQPESLQDELAGVLVNLAIALSELGQHQEADSAIREALDLYQEHAETGSLSPALIACLSTHSEFLYRLGKHLEALRVQEKAVVLYRRLSSTSPEAYQSELARALYILALRYDELKAWPQAGKAVSEAVHVLATAPGRTSAFFVQAITNYADWLDGVSRSPIEPTEAKERSRALRRGTRLLCRIAADPRVAAVLRSRVPNPARDPTSAAWRA